MINTLFLDTAADIHKQTCMASRAILSERKTNNLKTWTGMVGGCIFKIVIVEGAEGPYEIVFFGKGKVLIHHAFLKITAPRWDAINNRSLNIIHSEEKEEISRVNILVSIKS